MHFHPTREQLRELARIFNKALLKTSSVEDSLQIVFAHRLEPLRSAEARTIIEAVARRFEMPAARLFERSQRREFVQPRQVAMLLMRHAGMEFWRISRSLGLQHPTTAMHGCEQAAKSERLRAIVAELAAELGILRGSRGAA